MTPRWASVTSAPCRLEPSLLPAALLDLADEVPLDLVGVVDRAEQTPEPLAAPLPERLDRLLQVRVEPLLRDVGDEREIVVLLVLHQPVDALGLRRIARFADPPHHGDAHVVARLLRPARLERRRDVAAAREKRPEREGRRDAVALLARRE